MTNSRFEDLQRRCQKMKRVRIARVVFACLAIIVLVFSIYYALFFNIPQQAQVKEAIATQENTTTTHVSTKLPLSQSDKEEQKLGTVLESPLASEENQTYDTLRLSPVINNTFKSLPVEEKIDLKPSMAPPVEDFLTPPEAKKSLNISVKSLSNEDSLLKNFNSEKSFATAIALAQFYFEKKEYSKAIAFAKESSKLEPTSDRPWLIYAKSKFHLGEREEAIRSLELFIGYVNSNEVKELLTFYKGQQ